MNLITRTIAPNINVFHLKRKNFTTGTKSELIKILLGDYLKTSAEGQEATIQQLIEILQDPREQHGPIIFAWIILNDPVFTYKIKPETKIKLSKTCKLKSFYGSIHSKAQLSGSNHWSLSRIIKQKYNMPQLLQYSKQIITTDIYAHYSISTEPIIELSKIIITVLNNNYICNQTKLLCLARFCERINATNYLLATFKTTSTQSPVHNDLQNLALYIATDRQIGNHIDFFKSTIKNIKSDIQLSNLATKIIFADNIHSKQVEFLELIIHEICNLPNPTHPTLDTLCGIQAAILPLSNNEIDETLRMKILFLLSNKISLIFGEPSIEYKDFCSKQEWLDKLSNCKNQQDIIDLAISVLKDTNTTLNLKQYILGQIIQQLEHNPDTMAGLAFAIATNVAQVNNLQFFEQVITGINDSNALTNLAYQTLISELNDNNKSQVFPLIITKIDNQDNLTELTQIIEIQLKNQKMNEDTQISLLGLLPLIENQQEKIRKNTMTIITNKKIAKSDTNIVNTISQPEENVLQVFKKFLDRSSFTKSKKTDILRES